MLFFLKISENYSISWLKRCNHFKISRFFHLILYLKPISNFPCTKVQSGTNVHVQVQGYTCPSYGPNSSRNPIKKGAHFLPRPLYTSTLEEEIAIPKRWASLSDNADDSQDEVCEPVDVLNIPISNNVNDLNTNEKFEPTED